MYSSGGVCTQYRSLCGGALWKPPPRPLTDRLCRCAMPPDLFLESLPARYSWLRWSIMLRLEACLYIAQVLSTWLVRLHELPTTFVYVRAVRVYPSVVAERSAGSGGELWLACERRPATASGQYCTPPCTDRSPTEVAGHR